MIDSAGNRGASGGETASAPDQQPGLEVDVAAAKSTKSPAFQFYAGDFLSSSRVQRMSLLEVGAYIILLSHNWLSGSIPAEPGELAKLLKLPLARFRKLWAGPLSECFVKRGAQLTNPRLEAERRKQIAFRQRQSENGRKGGRRLGSGLSHNEPTDNPPLNPRDPISHVEDEERRPKSSSSSKRNDAAFAEFRDAYPRPRRKGGPIVEQAFLCALELAGGFPALMAALANHLASEQWANPRMIPGMDTWFEEERWRQELPAAGAVAASASNPKTAGNVAALQRFIDRGRSA